jgi:hypothetical protein
MNGNKQLCSFIFRTVDHVQHELLRPSNVPNRLHERSMNDFDHLESFSDRLKTLRNVHETFMQTVRKVGRLGTSHNKVTL